MKPWWSAALLCAGCSMVYDADDLGGGPAIEAIEPALVFEGEGAAMRSEDADAVRALPVVIRGRGFTADLAIELAGAGIEQTADDVAVSADGRLAAFALRVPIVDGDEGGSLTLTLRATGGATAGEITVVGLDGFEQDGGTIDTDAVALEPRYSHVALSGAITALGSAPLRLAATAGISLTGQLHADGIAIAPGAGGCPGAASDGAAQCGPGSGQNGVSSTFSGGGGGGGSFGPLPGQAGLGDGGAPGQPTGNAALVPLPPVDGAGRGAGGGGGGSGNLLGGGASGGGGGGVVALETPAVIRLGDGALISADGGAGGDAGPCATGGGGGGGSGGAIVLRAGAALRIGADVALRALGGAGGGDSGCAGGAGGIGRVRVDRPDAADLAVDPVAFLGPAFIALPVIAREPTLTVRLRGAPGADHSIRLDDDVVGAAAIGDDGLGEIAIELGEGMNLVCAQIDQGNAASFPEGQACAQVAYVR